jgi:hypothetical protein
MNIHDFNFIKEEVTPLINELENNNIIDNIIIENLKNNIDDITRLASENRGKILIKTAHINLKNTTLITSVCNLDYTEQEAEKIIKEYGILKAFNEIQDIINNYYQSWEEEWRADIKEYKTYKKILLTILKSKNIELLKKLQVSIKKLYRVKWDNRNLTAKERLKNGSIYHTASGNRVIYVKNVTEKNGSYFIYNANCYISLELYNNDLKHADDENLNIL